LRNEDRHSSSYRSDPAGSVGVAAWRDVIFSFVVCLTVLILAVAVGPPELNKPPDPTVINAVPRPDWYFFWYFSLMALLSHGSDKYLLWILPLALVAVPTFLPVLFNAGLYIQP
jgi:ubiquinol-cytochrome c reductase cytochrome b subunit